MVTAHTTAPTMAGIGTMASAPLMLNQRLRSTLNGMAIPDTTAPTMVGITTMASAPPMLSLSPRGTTVVATTAEATTAAASTESALLKERERQFLRQSPRLIPNTTTLTATLPLTTGATMASVTTTASAPPMLSLSPRGTSAEATTAEATTAAASTASA